MMDSMLDEYMHDVLADPETYTETFDAFESDADSMLILGQPIDDQLKTKNISSFAIPKKKANGASHELYGEDFESDEGEEIDEYEYEESFESPEKSSPNRHDLKELSSITFGQSNSLTHEQPQIYNAPKEKKKKLKKKKRTASTTSAVLGVNSKAIPLPLGRGAQVQAGANVNTVNSTTYPNVSGPSSLHKEKETPRGQHVTSHEPPSHTVSPRSVATRPAAPRVSTAGTTATHAGSVSGRKSQPVATNHSPHLHNSSAAQAHQLQYHTPQQHPHDPAAESFGRNAHTPGVYPVHPVQAVGHGTASVVSHANTSQSVVGRPHAHYVAGGAAFSAAMLQKQLDTALKQVAMYRKENEALQSHLDGAGINEAIERYKALLITKEHTIHQLESENNGLKSIARYQGKFLAEQAHQPTGLDSIQHHDKQIEIMLTHTRKLKEKVKKMEEHEKELVEQNEHLQTQNGRIQRKNAKLKRLLAKAGVNSGEAAETLQQHQQDVLSELNHSAHLNSSPDRKKSVQDSDHSSHPHSHAHSNQNGSVAESHGSHTSQESLHGHDHDHNQVKPLAPPPSLKQSIKKVVEEKEVIIHKQAMAIEALEKSLQTQRARFMREIDTYKAQLTEAEAEQKKLEAELEKRERFGRNQVSTLKQIRASYEELSTGYKKLLLASELYDRDTAPPVRKEKSLESLPVVKEEVKPTPEQVSQPRAAVISDEAEEGEIAYVSPQRPASSRSSSSRGGSRSMQNLTFLTSESSLEG